MKAFNYTVIDMKRGKTKLFLMVVFGVCGFVFAQESVVSGIGYVFFAAVMLSASTFILEEKAETGFINLLPGSDRDRITGRFMTGIIYDAIAVLTGIAIVTVLYFEEQINMQYIPEFIVSLAGTALMYGAIQNVLFFAVGKYNSRQLMSLITIVPAIVFYSIVMGIGAIFENSEKEQQFVKISLWVQDNSFIAADIVLLLGILFTIAGIYITEKIIEGKDYA